MLPPSSREFLFTVRVKMELIKEEKRLKGTVVKIIPISYPKECKALLDNIRKFPQGM